MRRIHWGTSSLRARYNTLSSSTTQEPVKFFFFSLDLYHHTSQAERIQVEITLQFRGEPKPEGFKLLHHWASFQKSMPFMAQMAWVYLTVPATSAASKQIFSKGCWIASWQKSSLKARKFEKFIFSKVWYQAFKVPI